MVFINTVNLVYFPNDPFGRDVLHAIYKHMLKHDALIIFVDNDSISYIL